jgi:hypothetical protein
MNTLPIYSATGYTGPMRQSGQRLVLSFEIAGRIHELLAALVPQLNKRESLNMLVFRGSFRPKAASGQPSLPKGLAQRCPPLRHHAD